MKTAYLAATRIGDAILNGTAVVQDAGPEVWISGLDRDGVWFDVITQEDGTVTVEYPEDQSE